MSCMIVWTSNNLTNQYNSTSLYFLRRETGTRDFRSMLVFLLWVLLLQATKVSMGEFSIQRERRVTFKCSAITLEGDRRHLPTT